MKKYTAQITRPCNLHSASEQARDWNETMEMRIVVTPEGVVWIKKDRHDVGVNPFKAAGGIWYKKPKTSQAMEEWLLQVGAVEATFKGGPRGVK